MLNVLILAMAMVFSPVQANIGDVVGHALYTDIVAYVDGQPIRSYNIDGHTAIVVEDLIYHGFVVVWSEFDDWLIGQRTLFVRFNPYQPAVQTPFVPQAIPENQLGTVAREVLYTDIKVIFDDVLVESHNIGGETVIVIDHLANVVDASVMVWSPEDRTISLVRRDWSFQVETYPWNEGASTTGNFVVEIRQDRLNGGLVVSERYWNIRTIRDFSITHDGIYFWESRMMMQSGELAEEIRVFVDGEEFFGRFGARHVVTMRQHRFIFENPLWLDDFETIRIEFYQTESERVW